jgi:DNA-directed RNA polymerase specialized sigma24 family protein
LEDHRSPAELLGAAADGDRTAWADLVGRYSDLVWTVARSFELDARTTADVSRTAWGRLLQDAGAIRLSEALGGWLAAVVGAEARRVRAARRDAPLPAEIDPGVLADPAKSRRASVPGDLRAVVEGLSFECRQLLTLLLVTPSLSDVEIAACTGRPVEAIPSMRSRCLDDLRSSERG